MESGVELGSQQQQQHSQKSQSTSSVPRAVSDRAAMVRAARSLLAAVTRVLLLADSVVVKQLLLAKDKVQGTQSAFYDIFLRLKVKVKYKLLLLKCTVLMYAIRDRHDYRLSLQQQQFAYFRGFNLMDIMITSRIL